MGRIAQNNKISPLGSENRDQQIIVRLTGPEAGKLREIAASEGLAPGTMAYVYVSRGIKRHHARTIKKDDAEE